MKISLIFPPSIYQTKQTMPPLGIAWIAAVLRENGYKEVSLIDSVINNYNNEKVIEILHENEPDLIGVSFGTQNRFFAFDLIRRIKKEFPRVPIIVGGAHPTLEADDMLKNIKEIDIAVRGEGEYTMLELVKTLEASGEIAQVKGISYRDSNGRVVHNQMREMISDLDALPFPARDLLPIEKYQQQIPLSSEICTSMITSRGCPYNCVYCSTAEQWGHNFRSRSAENIIKEIEHIKETYGIEAFGFFDDCFTINKKRVIEFCQEVTKRGLNIKWWCEARANTVDEEVIDWMKRAGCVHIAMAIESGSNEVLKKIRKAITVEQAIEATRIIKAAGIKLKIFFMHGLPGETLDDLKKTVFLSRDLERKYGVDEVAVSYTMIYPGTEIEELAQAEGNFPRDFSWSADYSKSRSYPPLSRCESMPIYERPDLTYEQVFKTVKNAKIEYYLKHPMHLLKNLKRYRSTIKSWFTTKV